ncbi:MAG: hypothetical protein K2X34_02680 [Hyphomonadaceae bacterium]|nr:hypothetical protein [Hyphomonadaceae bacterium]
MRSDAYDAGDIDPTLRGIVDQARRRQAYAQAEAARERQARALAADERSARYYGDWSDGGANGLGRAEWSDGARYEGSWRRSRPNGMGVMQMASGIRYEGEFDNGAPTGRGVFWSAQGERLSGDALFRALMEARQAPAPSDTESAQ